MAQTFTVKIQRPLFTNEQNPMYLLYDEERERTQQLPRSVIPPKILELLGDQPKIYVKGHWSSIVGWALTDEVVVGETW